MTWLSRLLPPTMGRPRHAANHNRTTKQRRREMTLENLEHRIVLSNVSATFSAGVLSIQTDAFNNSFKIIETTAAAGGKVTVQSTAGSTTINSTAADFTTTAAVTSIKIKLVGTTDTDSIQIVGDGQGSPTTVKTVAITVDKTFLKLNVNDVNNNGAFTLTTKGKLDAHILDSAFASLSIDQSQGCCLAIVELGNDIIPGTVSVKEGGGDNDVINVHDSTLGSTYLSQGKGAGDLITVTDTTAKDVTAIQGDGKADVIEISGLEVSSTSFGVKTSQGDGDNDVTTIEDVTVYGTIPFNKIPKLVPSIIVNQGNGKNDIATVADSTVPGDISICQGDGANDYASITDSQAGIFILGYPVFGNMSITQGDGAQDQALVSGVTANNVYVSQGDGNADDAEVSDSTVYGNVVICQGDGSQLVDKDGKPYGYGDTALVDGVTGALGVISITQGNGNFDQATITNSDAVCGLFITQGWGSKAGQYGDNDYAEISNSTSSGEVTAYYDKAGNIKGYTASGGDVSIAQANGHDNVALVSGVTAGSSITICQGDGANDIATVESSSADGLEVPFYDKKGNVHYDLYGGYISITQGNGAKDQATVSDSTAGNSISICQGDGNYDKAQVLGSTAEGYTLDVLDQTGRVLYVIDLGGNISITQGDGYADQAIVDASTANNVYICQGNNIWTPVCNDIQLELAIVNNTTVTSDIVIHQGTQHVDPKTGALVDDSVGNYYVGIAAGVIDFDSDGNVFEVTPAGDVTAGGYTLICQVGGSNIVGLGYEPLTDTVGASFSTAYLDVFTGDLGGGYVVAANTTVEWGSAFGNDFTIDGGPFTVDADGDPSPDTGNTYYDAGGNTGVTASVRYNVV